MSSSINESEFPSPGELEAIVRVGADPHFTGGSYDPRTQRIRPGIDGVVGKLPHLDALALSDESKSLPRHLSDARHPHAKPALLAGFARGVEALHSRGFVHRGIDLAHLGIYKESESGGRGGRGFRGVVLSSPTIAAVGPPTEKGGGADNYRVRFDPSITTHVPKTHAVFRAPETYYIRSAADVGATAASNRIETSDLVPRYYAHGEKADVWSLGVAFAHVLSGAPLFKLVGAPPYTSMKGAERIEDMIARSGGGGGGGGGGGADVGRAVAMEASRWQAYRLFGDATASDDTHGDDRRWVNTKALVGAGVRAGLVSERHHSDMSDLLYKMLSPNPSKRATITDVLAHPAILSSGSYLPLQVPTLYSFAGGRQSAPIDGWTVDKDSAVTSTMRVVAGSKETAHLPVEAFFVMYDAAARMAAAFHAGEPTPVIRAAVVAAVRLCGNLYDQTFDLKGNVSTAACGGSRKLAEVSVHFEPHVHHFFKGKLRRNGYIFDSVHANRNIEDMIARYFIGSDKMAATFRASYLILDIPMFFSEYFAKYPDYHLDDQSSPVSIGKLFSSDDSSDSGV